MPVLAILKIGFMVFMAMFLIVVGDTAGKLLTSQGVSPFFVAWSRFFIAALVLSPLFIIKLEKTAFKFDKIVLLRAFLIVCGICCLLLAVQTETIANIFGAFFISPIVAYFLSTLILKEKISIYRTLCILVGFAGVFLVVKPGFGFSFGLLYALMAGFFHGSYLVATRKLANIYPPTYLLLTQFVFGAIALMPLGVSFLPSHFNISIVFLIFLSAFASAGGNYILVLLSKNTPSSLIAPFIYTQLISATGIGYVVFGDFPDKIALIGLIIILFSGFASYLKLGSRA
jgi:drug/metabolite transporter (DMT)-like permease